MPVVLIITTKEGETINYTLLDKSMIGRSKDCDIHIDDKQTSARHGVFEINEKGHVIYTDLGSSNGSFVANSKITSYRLKVNDVLNVGNNSVTIDRKSLNTLELNAVGTGQAGPYNDSLSLSCQKPKEQVPTHKKGKTPTKIIVLNKNLKKK